MLRGSRLDPYFAVPHGDMMLAGCYGLLRAYAASYPEAAEQIERCTGAVARKPSDREPPESAFHLFRRTVTSIALRLRLRFTFAAIPVPGGDLLQRPLCGVVVGL